MRKRKFKRKQAQNLHASQDGQCLKDEDMLELGEPQNMKGQKVTVKKKSVKGRVVDAEVLRTQMLERLLQKLNK